MTNEKNETAFEEAEGRVYELGFHLLPTIAQADVPVRFSELKSIIEKQGGEFISEDSPKLIKLAYKIAKTIKAEKHHYNDSYFGWVKFTLDPEKLETLEKNIKAFEPMLRYIIVKTVAENTMVTDGVHGAEAEDEMDEEGAVDEVLGTVDNEVSKNLSKNKTTDETIVE
jgi:ribosomal protein S6